MPPLPPADDWPPPLTAADAPVDETEDDEWDREHLDWVPDVFDDLPDVAGHPPSEPVPAVVDDEDGDGERRAAQCLLSDVMAVHHATTAGQARLVQSIASMVDLYGAPSTEPRSAAGVSQDHDVRAAAADQVAEEVGAALTLTDYSAHQLVERAVRLARSLPATLAALASGDLDWRRASIITDATSSLEDAVAAELDHRLCGPGGSGITKTSGQLPGEVDRVLHDIDRAAITERSRRKAAGRRVGCRSLADGMAELVAVEPAPAVLAMAAAVDSLGGASRTAAREGRGSGDPYAVPGVDGDEDRRGIDAHRFDAMVSAVTGASASAPASGSSSAPIELQVHLSTLLAADDEPGHLDGHGLVPAWMVRLVAQHARLRRILTDPLTGQLTGVDGHTYPVGWLSGVGAPGPHEPDDGRDDEPDDGPDGGSRGGPDGPLRSGPDGAPVRGAGPPGNGDGPRVCTPVDTGACPVSAAGGGSYRIPAAVVRLVRRRWGRCTAHGCRRAAARCDVDHVVSQPGGPTCPCNLAPLCRRHHLMKHGTPRVGDSRPAARWARAAGTRRWRWQVHRCTGAAAATSTGRARWAADTSSLLRSGSHLPRDRVARR